MADKTIELDDTARSLDQELEIKDRMYFHTLSVALIKVWNGQQRASASGKEREQQEADYADTDLSLARTVTTN